MKNGTLTGYLSNVTSAAETTFLQAKLPAGAGDYWIGGSDAAAEGAYRWADGPEAGTTINYFNWASGQPNNRSNEDYLEINGSTYSSKWNDDGSSRTGNFYVEYNAPANSTLMRREINLPAPAVVTISGNADPAVISALNYANFTGSVSGYTTSLSGSQLTFTSTQPATNINPNISYTFTPAAGSPTVFGAPVVTDGGNGALANASLQFPPSGLNAGDSVTVSGLRFTAGRAITAGEVASAFASLANGAITGAGSSYGSYSGALTGFSSGAVVNSNQLVFTQIVSGTQTSIEKSSSITKVSSGTGLTVDKFSTAQNAIFTVGDTSYSKTSNTISDAITGVTLSLMEEGVANVLVALGEDKSEETIKGFMTAYNDLIKSTNSMTANSSNSIKPGAFANSPTNLSFISEIKRKVAEGASYNIPKAGASGQPARFSLASLGLEYQLDGTLAFNPISLLTAQSTGLREKLLSGLKVGYQSGTDNLEKLLDSQISSISSLADQTSENTQSVKSLNKEKDQIKARLDKIQAGYIVQYANLNKLLFQLNSTSSSLESALDGLTGMNSKK
jgi:flagellar hook-associated protein 2